MNAQRAVLGPDISASPFRREVRSMEEKILRRTDENQSIERSAAVNAALALSSFKVAEPYLKDGYKKLKGKTKN
jgi:hypothetical protein